MRSRFLPNKNGFTLIELVVVMGVFVIVLMIASTAFKTVLQNSNTVSKSEVSNIEGVVGLEMMRHDLTQAGFGLFTDIDTTISAPSYSEATGTFESTYNDSPNRIPRPVRGANNITTADLANVINNSDYLVIKATTLGASMASQKWTYINGVSTSKIWSSGINDLKNGSDYVIAVKQSYNNGTIKRRLVYNTASPNSLTVTFRTDGAYNDPFRPNANGVLYYYYGIADTSAAGSPIAPFNRTDYAVKRIAGEVPSRCAPGAGVLYKMNMIQQGGGSAGQFTSTPVLDCVADMQVVLGWNTSNPPGTNIDTYSNADVSTYSGATALPALDANYVSQHLKVIKVYILAQDGDRDPSYANTNTAMLVGDIYLGAGDTATETDTLSHYVDLTGANYQNYRWKLYRIVVRPRNMN